MSGVMRFGGTVTCRQRSSSECHIVRTARSTAVQQYRQRQCGGLRPGADVGGRCCACMQRMRSGGLVHQPGAGAVRADGGVQRSCSCCCRTRRNSTLPFCCSAAVSALKLGLAGSGAASSTTIAAGCSGPAVSARLTFGMAAFCLRCRRTRPAEAAATYAAVAVPGSGCCGARRHL